MNYQRVIFRDSENFVVVRADETDLRDNLPMGYMHFKNLHSESIVCGFEAYLTTHDNPPY